jgi:hypothetical protein
MDAIGVKARLEEVLQRERPEYDVSKLDGNTVGKKDTQRRALVLKELQVSTS